MLTADHGMVDTDRHHRIDLAKEKELAKDVVAVAGSLASYSFTFPTTSLVPPQLVALAWAWLDPGELAITARQSPLLPGIGLT